MSSDWIHGVPLSIGIVYVPWPDAGSGTDSQGTPRSQCSLVQPGSGIAEGGERGAGSRFRRMRRTCSSSPERREGRPRQPSARGRRGSAPRCRDIGPSPCGNDAHVGVALPGLPPEDGLPTTHGVQPCCRWAFGGGFRRSELVALDVGDVTIGHTSAAMVRTFIRAAGVYADSSTRYLASRGPEVAMFRRE